MPQKYPVGKTEIEGDTPYAEHGSHGHLKGRPFHPSYGRAGNEGKEAVSLANASCFRQALTLQRPAGRNFAGATWCSLCPGTAVVLHSGWIAFGICRNGCECRD